MKACMPSMNDSSDPVDTSSTRTDEVGSAASRRATSISAMTPVPLSFAPGTVRVEPICANTAAAPADTTPPASRSARLPVERAGGGERRAGEHRPHQRRARVAALDQRREAPPDERRDARVEDQPRLRGVVMGDQHDRAAGVVRADLGHDVEGLAPRQQAAHVVRAAGDVVPHSRRGQRRQRSARARGGGARSGAPAAPAALSSASGPQ